MEQWIVTGRSALPPRLSITSMGVAAITTKCSFLLLYLALRFNRFNQCTQKMCALISSDTTEYMLRAVLQLRLSQFVVRLHAVGPYSRVQHQRHQNIIYIQRHITMDNPYKDKCFLWPKSESDINDGPVLGKIKFKSLSAIDCVIQR